jgi:hypothetical protein
MDFWAGGLASARFKNYNSLELSLTGEVIFKAFWRGTYNWQLNLSPIASECSRLVKNESCDDFVNLRQVQDGRGQHFAVWVEL